MTAVKFFVPGIPAPQGSKRHLGGGVLVESSKRVKPWRTDVRETALRHFTAPLTGPVDVHLHFTFPRPKSHFGTGRNAGRVKQAAPPRYAHTQRPDLDKLIRAVLDALTGVAWRDDSQVVGLTATKRWEFCSITGRISQEPGVGISIVGA